MEVEKISFREVIQLFEKRRAELIDILRNRKEEIDLSRQHQIYGAVKEIELFLETLGYYHETMMREDQTVATLLNKPDIRPFMAKMKDSLRDSIIK